MRTRTATTVLTATLLLGLTACGSSDPEVTTKPNPKASAPAAAPKAPSSTPTPTQQQDAGIGDTITLKGFEEGQQVAVTIKKVSDPAVPKDQFFKPEDGSRWIGIQVEILNTGTAAYDDSPGNGMQIADSEGQRFNGVIADIKAGPSMAAGVTLKPGAKALGWLVFEAPKNAKIDSVQFGMNSGFADQTGEWKLK